MARRVCPQCGAPVDYDATECRFCGEKLELPQPEKAAPPQAAPAPPSVPAPQPYVAPQPQQYAVPQPQMLQPVQPTMPQPQQPMQGYGQGPYRGGPEQGWSAQAQYNPAFNPAWPVKSKIVAGVLAFFLGGLGVHKFYLGHIGSGIVYLLLCWTGIPEVLGLIDGIIYLCSSDESFCMKHHCRIG